jgi:large subunit ribosomal protein L29
MKITEIRELTDEELATELGRLRRHQFDVRSQAVTEKLEDPSMVTKAKRDIARILTVQREREVAASQGQDSQTDSGKSA